MLLLYTITIFLSAFLVFLVQPMIGKIFLPWVGGAPAAWNTCMFFFQLLLLGGYYYIHLSLKKLNLKKQMLIHFAIMVSALVTLPIAFAGDTSVPESPAWWLLKHLFLTTALPFFVVSSTAPLLQKWFFHTSHSRAANPFFLYAASNAGSLTALLVYPLVIEPNMNVAAQASFWGWGFLALFILMLSCAWFVKTKKTDEVQIEPEPIAKATAMRWVMAAFIPSSLFLAVTQYVTRDIAPVPMIWIVPLMIYLLTFIIAFSDFIKLQLKYLKITAVGAIIIFFPVYFLSLIENKGVSILVHLVILFLISLLCHKDLAETKPKAENLTIFYLWLSLGGVLGGFFNSFTAPYLFDGNAEYPLAILLTTLFIMPAKIDLGRPPLKTAVDSLTYALLFVAAIWFINNIPLHNWTLNSVTYFSLNSDEGLIPSFVRLLSTHSKPIRTLLYFIVSSYSIYILSKHSRFSLFGFTAFVMCILFYINIGQRLPVVYRSRNFFGTKEILIGDFRDVRQLVHGSTVHGIQSMAKEWRKVPLSYYHKNGPLGDLFNSRIGIKPDLKFAVVGLGVGTTAAYALPGQEATFYEIDPEVVEIAQDTGAFTYLEDMVGSYSIIVGDGRLKLAEAEDGIYDMILLDAFSSDYIPVHLMTVEALEIYLDKLHQDGLLIFHISNRYLNLKPLMEALAQSHDLHCLMLSDRNFNKDADENWHRSTTEYVAMSRAHFNMPLPLVNSEFNWLPYQGTEVIKPWTDDFSSLLPLLKF